MKNNLQTTIGVEVHIQLNTARKMFCLCSNRGEDEEINKFVCPICLGMPGTLPITNKKAIESVVKLGMALGCEIAEKSKFDRKHYFYPDLPKGYQVSQYDMPFVKSGVVTIDKDIDGLEVRINRIHLEEDAGKLLHQSGSYTTVDLNRAGTPLAELVTEPDIKTPAQAKLFVKQLQKIVKAINVSDANMEKGHLRCDANISVTDGSKMSPIIEIKNLNSFKFIEKALAFEENRLKEEFSNYSGGEGKVTRGFDSKTCKTYSLRTKEDAKDYRYFPEPDIPPFDLTDRNFIDLENIKSELPELPSQVISGLVKKGLSVEDAEIVSSQEELREKIQQIISNNSSRDIIRRVAKLLVNETESRIMSGEQLVSLAAAIDKNNIPSNLVRKIIKGELTVADALANSSKSDPCLDRAIDTAVEKNAEAVKKYRLGKKEVIGFLIGQVMKEAGGGVRPSDVKNGLEKKIAETE